MALHAQRKSGEVRPLQVRITYDVELGDTIETKELPFVLGVLADLSGKPDEPLPPFEKRNFVEIDRENFSAFMRGTRARLAFRVDNKLVDDDSKIGMELRFADMEDFEPERVVLQVEPLRKLLEVRKQLAALLAQTEDHAELRERLSNVLYDSELLHRVAIETGIAPGKDEGSAETYPVKDEEVRSLSVMSTVPGPRWQGQPYMNEEARSPGVTSAVPGLRRQEPPDVIEQDFSILDNIIFESRIGGDVEQREQSRQQIATLVEEVMVGNIWVHRDLHGMITARLAALDALLSRQLNEILHASDFQRLEGTWRGLYQLVHQSKTSTLLKIRVLNVSKQELHRDLQNAPARQKSVFFKKVCEEEFGTFGGTPYGTLIGDYEFGRHPQDMALLENISRVAAAAYAPFVAAASPQLFRLESFTELSRAHNLAKSFASVDYVKWQRFRDSEESRYVGLTLPRLLMRLPYGPDTVPVEAFHFVEDVDGTDHSKYLWGNAVCAFGACLTTAFARYHWCAATLGAEGRGLVQGLPMHAYITDDGEVELKCPTEITITDRREEELSQLGFIPLVHCKGTDYAAFFSMQACYRSKAHPNAVAHNDARLSTQLPYVLAVSRFVHYLKAITRDKIGSFRNRKDCEDYLNRWIANYVLLDDSGSLQAQAQNPLREARVEVSEVPGRAGIYRAEIFLKPHFQLDERTVSHHIVAELSTAGQESSGRR